MNTYLVRVCETAHATHDAEDIVVDGVYVKRCIGRSRTRKFKNSIVYS